MKNKLGFRKKCEICGSNDFVDAHHYDCKKGKISSETINLCRRCHRTYHDLGPRWFEEKYLDKALKLENRRREISYSRLKEPKEPLLLMKLEDIKRSDYWKKTHRLIDNNNSRRRVVVV